VLLGAQTEDRERALALGMVDELTEPDELLPRAVALADRSPKSHRLVRVPLRRPANPAIKATAGADAAVLAGWTSDHPRLRIEAALVALARR
jgi:enoyl-CoA hydratase